MGALFLWLGFIISGAQSQSLYSTLYTTKDGLISDWVTALAQDSRGYLWIGTSEGLARFDGISFVNMTTKDGLPNNFIESIAESGIHPGMMIVGTHRGLAALHNGAVRMLPIPTPGGPPSITRILVDRRGTAWLATSDGLYAMRDTTVWKVDGVGIDDISDLQESPRGSIVIAGAPDLLFLSPESGEVRRIGVGLRAPHRTTFCAIDPDGTMWVSAEDSLLFHLRDSVVLDRTVLACGNTSHITDGGPGSLWASSLHGVYRIPKRTPNDLSLDLPHRTAMLLRDREGILWSASRAGLYMLSSPELTAFEDTIGWDIGVTQPQNLVDGHRHVWSQTAGGFYEYLRGPSGDWRRAFHGTPEVRRPQWSMIDAHDRLWVSTFDTARLYCYDIVGTGREGSSLVLERSMAVGRPPHYFFLRDSTELWLACPDTPTVVRRDIRTGNILSRFNPLLAGFGPRCSLIDDRGTFWVGEMNVGLFAARIDSPARWRTLTSNDGLPDNAIRSICDDGGGGIWIGTRYGGAVLYRQGAVARFDITNGLPSNWVHSIVRDSRGRIWFSTSLGLAYLESSSARTLHSVPGVQGQRILGFGEIENATYWIRTGTAELIYDFRAQDVGVSDPIVSISGMNMSGRVVDPDSAVECSRAENLFSVSYTGICFQDPRRLRYLYRLEGADPAWQGPTDLRSISYSGLRPGNYMFLVKAVSGNGAQSVHPAIARFTIAPAYWERWWFRALGVLVVVSIAVAIALQRRRILKQRARVQEDFSRQLLDSQEQERKRIAAALHDSLGQNLIISKNHAMMALRASEETSSREHLSEISAMLSQSLEEVREIAYDLRPYHLDRIGLTRTIEFMLEKVQNSTRIHCVADLENIDHLLAPASETILYRVVQESLNNIVKHAEATELSCKARRTAAGCTIEIRDNGRGFDGHADPPSPPARGGLGLAGMTERVRLLHGTMSVVSEPGKGTSITLTIPAGDDE